MTVLLFSGVHHPHPSPPLEGEGICALEKECTLPFKGRARVGMGDPNNLEKIKVARF
jgi:hypothetical protein